LYRLHDTMSIHFHHPDLRNKTEDVVQKCDTCQRYKQVGRGHGHTAPREAGIHPWREVAVDTIGPWTIELNGEEIKFNALTIIDTTTNLVELIRLDNMSSAHTARQFENTWLARYPKPMHCIYDQGGNFKGSFLRMLHTQGISRAPVTVKAPQANAICERMHQVVGNTLCVLQILNPPAGLTDANRLVDQALANAMYATRATMHGTIKATPGSIAFNRDMVLDIPLTADLLLMQEMRQQLIDKRLIEANRHRISHDYQPGDQCLKLIYKPDKLEPRAEGPYLIEAVHTNGTVTLRLNATTIERISIRRIKPYYS